MNTSIRMYETSQKHCSITDWNTNAQQNATSLTSTILAISDHTVQLACYCNSAGKSLHISLNYWLLSASQNSLARLYEWLGTGNYLGIWNDFWGQRSQKRSNQNGWNYNHRTWHSNGPSWDLAHQAILGHTSSSRALLDAGKTQQNTIIK